MNRVALVTGADRGLGLEVTRELLRRGWTVFAGQNLDWPELPKLAGEYPETLHLLALNVGSTESVRSALMETTKVVAHLDLVIANAGIQRSAQIPSIRSGLSYEDMQDEYNVNALGAVRVVETFLPLLDVGTLKRLCFVSSEASSIGASTRKGWFGYCMSKSALNMAVKNLHNDLSPEGFTFRLYHPGWIRSYMSGTKNMEAHLEPEEAAQHAVRYFLDDDVPAELVLRDWQGEPYPW